MIWLPFIFACSFLLTYLVLKLANKKNIIDVPNERSSHTIPTPRGGGLAIAITWLTTVALLALFQKVALPLFLALSSVILVSRLSSSLPVVLSDLPGKYQLQWWKVI